MFPISYLPQLTWRAKEVVKEINNKPHVLTRIEISGSFFPHRAVEPFMRVVTDQRHTIPCWFAKISDDNSKLRGYFPVDLPKSGTIEFGYGAKKVGSLPIEFKSETVGRLDRKRLPRDIVEVSESFLKRIREE